jgi:hypothetical protein
MTSDMLENLRKKLRDGKGREWMGRDGKSY